jgi:hypothetical protein
VLVVLVCWFGLLGFGLVSGGSMLLPDSTTSNQQQTQQERRNYNKDTRAKKKLIKRERERELINQ